MSNTSSQIIRVDNFNAFLTAKFNAQANCVLFERRFPEADFEGFAQEWAQWCFKKHGTAEKGTVINHTFGKDRINFKIFEDRGYMFHHRDQLNVFMDEVYPIDFDKETKRIRHQGCTPEIHEAYDALITDLNTLDAIDCAPEIRLIREYSEEGDTPLPFHADEQGGEYGRIGTCYTDPTTEYLLNEDVTYGGQSATDVTVRESAQIHTYPVGAWTRIATQSTKETTPFIHRGVNRTDGKFRMLLLAKLNKGAPRPQSLER